MAQIEAHIGDVSGGSQVAVGNYIVQIGRVEGGVVNILNNAPPPPRVRPQPVLLRPKIFPKLLDRQTETTTVIDALKSQQSVECTGEPGIGRTSLLRHLAHQSELATAFPAGVVYFQVNQQSAPDLLKSLFDAFYICDFPIKPNETEMRHYLQPLNALVLLDDIEIDAQQVEHLMNIAPSCTFIAVTKARNLSTDVAEVPVKGLPIADALVLYQNELGRTLSSEEENDVRSACESLGCIPLRVVRAAHEARDQKPSSSGDEKKVLAALAVFSGTIVAAEHVAAVAGVQNAQSLLDDLEQRDVVQSHDGRYALAPDVKPEQPGDQKPWFTRALNYFVNWTEQHRKDHALIGASGGAILLLLKQAVDAQAWNEVRRLGHASEEALTVTGKWDMWANVLDSIELAAKAQGDVAERAWVLHQLGTRALALGDRYAAETNLRDALGLREQLHDLSGAEVTRHNLNILLGPLPPEHDDTDRGGADVGKRTTPLWSKIGLIVLVGLVAITALLVWRYLRSTPIIEPPPTPTPQPTATIEQIPTPTVTTETPPASSPTVTVEDSKPTPTAEPTKPPTSSPTATVGDTPTPRPTATVGDTPTPKPTAEPTKSVEEPPKPPVRITRFEVKRRIIGSPQLCYALQNARSARIDPGIGELNNLTNGCPNLPSRDQQTYTLTATGMDGKTETRSITFTPPEPPKPLPIGIISFSGPARPIKPRSEAKLCYSTLGEGTAAITPQPGRVQPSIRNCVTVFPARTTEYTLTVTTPQGEKKSKSLTVTVAGEVIQ
jgi:hypothetical protein